LNALGAVDFGSITNPYASDAGDAVAQIIAAFSNAGSVDYASSLFGAIKSHAVQNALGDVKSGATAAGNAMDLLGKKLGSTANAFSGFFNGFTAQIRQSGDLFGTLADRALSALDKIADKLLDQAFTGLLGNLFGGLLGGVTGAGSMSATALLGGLYAKGGVFDRGNVVPFARGGVVSRPTVFPFASGVGLMGEAGPEAIMPLRRGPGGSLGVAASGNSTVHVTIGVDESGTIVPVVERIAGDAVTVGIDRYDRFQAPRTIAYHKNTNIIETGARVRAAM
jgi:hypothetical protein